MCDRTVHKACVHLRKYAAECKASVASTNGFCNIKYQFADKRVCPRAFGERWSNEDIFEGKSTDRET